MNNNNNDNMDVAMIRKRFNTKPSAKFAKVDGKEENHGFLVVVPFPWVSMVTVLMPLTAFVYCIIYSFFYHYEWTTQTHCNVWNFAPSISAAIGLFRPQKVLFDYFEVLHSNSC